MPHAKHMKPGDPNPWIARAREDWLEDANVTRNQWTPILAQLEELGWIERGKGLFKNKIAVLIRARGWGVACPPIGSKPAHQRAHNQPIYL